MSDFAFQLLLTLDATLRVATPLILCAMAGIFFRALRHHRYLA